MCNNLHEIREDLVSILSLMGYKEQEFSLSKPVYNSLHIYIDKKQFIFSHNKLSLYPYEILIKRALPKPIFLKITNNDHAQLLLKFKENIDRL